MEENKKDVLPLEGEPLSAPQISTPVVNALAAALSKIETYVPTQYIDDGPPDIDADHLNHAEQAIMRVTNLANGAADAISALQSQVTQLNNNLGNTVKYLRTDNIDNAAETLWPKIKESSSYDFTWIPETGEGVTKGAQARVIGFYNNSNYESQMILSYLTSAPVVQREKINGSWGNWKVFATKSDIQSGKFTIVGATTGEISSVRVNFSKPMRAVPRVVVSWQDNNNTFKTYGMLVADNVDVNGFTVSALATATTASSWYGSYIAICV